MRALGYVHPLRFWNYLPHINGVPEGGLEVYQQFCSGRLGAFREYAVAEQDFPAASALGSFGGNAVFYALAAKHKGRHFENMLQQSAYHYPLQYGPSSPSFARATAIKNSEGGEHIFVSGTASVLGHATVAVGDLDEQLSTTFNNLDALVQGINPRAKFVNLKVYIRHQQDSARCQERVALHYPGVPAIYLHADICRADLLVEIEAVCQGPDVNAA